MQNDTITGAPVVETPRPTTKTKPTKKPKTKRRVLRKRAKPASTPKGNRWTDELKAKVRKRLKSGETYVAIASTFKVTPQTLWAILNRKPKAKARRRS